MMYKNNINSKLENALMQIHMLERIGEGHVVATAQQVTDTVKRLRKLTEEAKRLVELSK